MNSIRSEWPLLFFTTCAPLCAGAWIVAATLVLFDVYPQIGVLTTGVYGAALCILLVFSLGLSTLHLGKPMKALRAFMRLGNSTVSNEVFMGTLFAVFSILYFAMSIALGESHEILGILLALVAVSGGLFVLFQCLAYRMRTVSTWNSFSFSIEFAIIALLSGICLEGILLCFALPASFSIRFALVAAEFLCCVVMVCVVCVQGTTVAKSIIARQNSSLLLKQWRSLSVVRVVALVAGSMIWGYGMLAGEPILPLTIVGGVVLIVGIVIGRYAFYRFYINVGLQRT